MIENIKNQSDDKFTFVSHILFHSLMGTTVTEDITEHYITV